MHAYQLVSVCHGKRFSAQKIDQIPYKFRVLAFFIQK